MQSVVGLSGLTVMVASLNDQSLRFLGSGFVCSENGYVLTSNHILDLTANLQIIIPPPINEFSSLTTGQVSFSTASVAQIDAKSDIALLKVSGLSSAIIPPRIFDVEGSIRVGDEVGCLGFPFGDRGLHTMKLTRTIICGKSLSDSGTKTLHVDANLHEGNSGGPVVNAVTGQVIGLVSGRFSPIGMTGASISIGGVALGTNSTISFVTPISYGISLMKEEKIFGKSSNPF